MSKAESMKYFLCVLGMVMIVEGLPYFAFPEKVKGWLSQLLQLPDQTLRKMGLALMLAGLLVVAIGRS
jgi:uncharacterized protein YjeT (DUF2065 family)